MIGSQIRHILWDWNGTLLDDAQYGVGIMNKILKEKNLPLLDLKRYRDIFDFPVRRYYDRLGFDFNKDDFETVGMQFIDAYYKNFQECKLRSDELRKIPAPSPGFAGL